MAAQSAAIRADREELSARRREESLQFRAQRIRDRRRKVVAKPAENLLGRVVHVKSARDERTKGGNEQTEGEDGEQEPVRHLRSQARHVVVLDPIQHAAADAGGLLLCVRLIRFACDR